MILWLDIGFSAITRITEVNVYVCFKQFVSWILCELRTYKWCDHRSYDCDLSNCKLIFICFIPFTGTMNLINWPAPNVWVFIAQLVKHCSANAETMGSNPAEAPKTFFGLNCDCLNRNHNCDDHTFIFICTSSVHIIFVY